MQINDIGEFGLIRKIANLFDSLTPEGWDGIGDDCAIIPIDSEHSMVVTSDMLVEDVHFISSRISAYELGRKALAVNLSDIAAMGARPTATFLSIGLPSSVEVEWCDAFFEGYRSFGVPLLGGDTTSSKSGIVVNITVLGSCSINNIKRRRDAKVGDLVVVNAHLGDSAAGLQLLLSNAESSNNLDFKTLIAAHHNPEPSIEQGAWLGTQKSVHAMMDISDGVASDLKHILRASQCNAIINMDEIPISDTAQRVAAQMGWNMVELAVSGGEDYGLLMTVEPEHFDELALQYSEKFGTKLYVIGQIVEQIRGVDDHANCREDLIAWNDSANTNNSDTHTYSGFRHF